MNKIIITDEQFIIEFADFNLKSKEVIVDELLILSEKNSDNKLLVKAITLQLIQTYLEITETVLMFLYALKESKNSGKSFIYHYKNIEIKEYGNSKYSSEKILMEIQNVSLNDFIHNFNLPTFESEYNDCSLKQKEQIHQLFGTHEKIQEQFNKEFSNLKIAIQSIIANRTLDREEMPLYKINNKLKHGMQFFNQANEDYIHVINNILLTDKNTTEIEVDTFYCKHKTNLIFKEQISTMISACRHLLLSYFLSITKQQTKN
jgi:hypothetical protein